MCHPQLGDGGTTGSIVGDVTHNGLLIFNRSDDYDFSGDIIQGFGSNAIVEQRGDGVLTLSGSNSYAGGTIISGGTIQISDDTNLGDISGAVTIDGGTLKLDNSTILDPGRGITLGNAGGTFDVESAFAQANGDITGAGHLTVRGAGGFITLFGNNGYAGGTTITGGAMVVVEADGNFGANTGGIILDDGAVMFFDDVTLAATRAMTLGPGGGTFIVNAPASEIAGAITGSGALTVAADPFFGGGGDLYLTGINDYTGGTILKGDAGFGIPASIVITDDRNLGRADGDISIDTGGIRFDADVTLNAARNIAVEGDGALFDVDGNTVSILSVISGPGPVGKDGSGTLILAGNNTNTGLLDIVDGTVQIGNGGTSGSLAASEITSSGTLAFNRSDSLIFSADISDACGCFAGIVTQIGTGTTVLAGDNSYTGGTIITAGILEMGNNDALGTGPVTLNGGTLQAGADGGLVAMGQRHRQLGQHGRRRQCRPRHHQRRGDHHRGRYQAELPLARRRHRRVCRQQSWRGGTGQRRVTQQRPVGGLSLWPL